MGMPTKFDRLPESVRQWAIAELRRCGYGDLDRIAKELSEQSGIPISRSGLGRFSRTLKTLDKTRPDLKLSQPTQAALMRLAVALVEALQALQADQSTDE